MPESPSSSTSNPPGRKYSTMRRIASSCAPGSQNSNRREHTTSNEPTPSTCNGSCKMSCWHTSRCGTLSRLTYVTSTSVATTCPPGPTWSANQTAMLPRARAYLEASPARLNHGAPLARRRIEDPLQKTQPIIFRLLTPVCAEPIRALYVRSHYCDTVRTILN